MAVYLTANANVCKNPSDLLPLPTAKWLVEATEYEIVYFFGQEHPITTLYDAPDWAAGSDKRYPVMQLILGELHGTRAVIYEGRPGRNNWPTRNEFIEKGYRIEEGGFEHVVVLTRDGLGPDGQGSVTEEDRMRIYICWGDDDAPVITP